jgi:hypothetical protein
MLSLTGSMIAVPTCIASCGCEQVYLDTFRRVLCQRSADAERFVVGMREHGH